jgi:hypothetical protein
MRILNIIFFIWMKKRAGLWLPLNSSLKRIILVYLRFLPIENAWKIQTSLTQVGCPARQDMGAKLVSNMMPYRECTLLVSQLSSPWPVSGHGSVDTPHNCCLWCLSIMEVSLFLFHFVLQTSLPLITVLPHKK